MLEFNWLEICIEMMQELANIIGIGTVVLGLSILLMGVGLTKARVRWTGFNISMSGVSFWLGSSIITMIAKSKEFNNINLSMSLSMIPILIGILLVVYGKRATQKKIGGLTLAVGTAQFVGELLAIAVIL